MTIPTEKQHCRFFEGFQASVPRMNNMDVALNQEKRASKGSPSCRGGGDWPIPTQYDPPPAERRATVFRARLREEG